MKVCKYITLPTRRFTSTRNIPALILFFCSIVFSLQTLAQNPDRLRPSQTLDDYELAIERIETELGAWGAGLDEQLGGLGKTYQQRGQHSEAIAVYERAIHVNKINRGLYNLTQVPLVNGLIESLKARGLWNDVHDRNQYLYWLHQRNYGDSDPRLLPIIDTLGRSYLNDYAINPNGRNTDQLMDAHALFSNAASIVSERYGADDLRMVPPLRGLAIANYHLAAYSAGLYSQIDRARITDNVGGREISKFQFQSILNGYSTPTTNGVYFPDPDVPTQLLRLIKGSYPNGKQALEQTVAIFENNPKAAKGSASLARIELADWHALFRKDISAKNLYQQAYEELANSPDTQHLVERHFGQPCALPDFDLITVPSAEAEQETRQNSAAAGNGADHEKVQTATPPVSENVGKYVLVKFSVNRQGEADDIEFLESHPEESVGLRSRVKKNLQSLRFRPRYENGYPVETAGLLQKFVFSE